MVPERLKLAFDRIQADGIDDLFVPATITPHLSSLSVSIGASPTLQLVQIIEIKGMKTGRCFDNCAHLTKRFGGEVVHGWAWHQVSDLFVIAEFHGVVRDPDGNLVDVTPPIRPRRETTFSEDPVRVAADVPQGDLVAALKVGVPNQRFALKDIPEVHEWIAAEEGHARLSRRRLDGEPLTFDEVIQVIERNADARAAIVAIAKQNAI